MEDITISESGMVLKPSQDKHIISGITISSDTSIRVGEYRVDYDRKGLIRAQFVIDRTVKPWPIIDLIDAKVANRIERSELHSVKKLAYPLDVNKITWVVRWVYPGLKLRGTLEI